VEQGAAFTAEALKIYRDLRDERGEAEAAADLALFQLDRQQMEEGKALLARSEEIAARVGDKRLLAGVARVRAVEATIEGRYAEALALGEKSLALYRELGDGWFCGIVQWGVGVTATFLGDYEKARSNFQECLRGSWSLGNRWAVAYPLEAFAALAVAEGKYERGARLLGAAEAIRAEFGTSTETTDHPALRMIFARASEELVKPELVAARKAGRSLTAAEAVAFALESAAMAP
jgi:non-specific serine/threonine protein kinase